MTNFSTEDIPYRDIDGQALLGRMYRPVGAARALVVEVHGGAWTQGDRLNNSAIHEALAAHGIAVFALDFRMAPAHPYPAAVRDVNFGIRWAKARRESLAGVACPVGGLGTSSGGHLLALNALLPEAPLYTDPAAADSAETHGANARLDFAIACWPILDPLARYRMAQAKNLAPLLAAHHAFWPDEAAMAQGNPRLLIERGEAGALPPLLILQGEADENVEHRRADEFAAAYRAAGAQVELEKYPGEAHNFIAKAPAAPVARAALERIKRYIDMRLASSPDPRSKPETLQSSSQ
jgi:acetyl esterase/lipase